MNPYDFRRRRKVFESREMSAAIYCAWYRGAGMESQAQVSRIIGVSTRNVYRWRYGETRPDTSALRRMLRLMLWKCLDGFLPSSFAAIDWAGLSVEYINGQRDPNPFVITPPSRQNNRGITFAYGSLRDTGALVRDFERAFAIEWGKPRYLLGMPLTSSSYDHYRRWIHGQNAIGPLYLARLLGLTLIEANGYLEEMRLGDMWAVDWKGRKVEWKRASIKTREAEDPYFLPPSPFHRLLLESHNYNGAARRKPRPGTMKVHNADFAEAAVPVRGYDTRAALQAAGLPFDS